MEKLELAAICCLALWGAALTVFVAVSGWSSCNKARQTDKSAPSETSGPVVIRNFFRDKFGNLVSRDKRKPRRGDDAAAFTAEQKEQENG